MEYLITFLLGMGLGALIVLTIWVKSDEKLFKELREDK